MSRRASCNHHAAIFVSASLVFISLTWLAFAQIANGQPPAGSQAYIRPSENLKAEGIPEIPRVVADRVLKYTEARAANVLDWHPSERSLLISTRFGNSNQIHRVSTPGGSRYQLTFYPEPVGTAEYEPKLGSFFLFTKDTGGNEFAQVYRHDTITGRATLLTDGGRSQNGGWKWNNQMDSICYASTRRNGADRDLWVMNPVDPASDRLAFQLTGGGWSVDDWSPDDTSVVVREILSVNKVNLHIGNIATGKLTPCVDPNAEVAYGRAEFSRDGKGLYVTSDEQGEFQQLAYLSLSDRSFQWLTQDIPWDVESFELSHDGTRIAFTVNNRGASDLYFLDTKTLVKQKVPNLPLGVVSLDSWRRDDSEIALTITSAQTSSDVYSLHSKTMEITRWTESELGGLVPTELRTPELIEWQSFDGRSISGFLYQPPKRFIGRRPVIINIHGGPEGQSRPTFLGRSNYFVNELGCAILFPNVRGSTGFGKSFVKLDNGMKRLDSVQDIGALLDWIAKEPTLDPERVMVTGGSYGGYMTLACAVEYNQRIACSLDVVGISHFGTFLKNTESYRRDLRRVEYGDERDPDMASFFEKMAPLNNAGKITKPLFVVQGGNDPRVPLSEAEQMVAKVKNNQSPVWYLMANDEGHGFRKKNNADFQFYATVLFVEQYLLRAERQ